MDDLGDTGVHNLMPWNGDLSKAIENEFGQVALCHYQTTNPLIEVGGIGYKFETRWNICLAWVSKKDAPAILNVKRRCCGGSMNPSFRVANEHDVRMWTNGTR